LVYNKEPINLAFDLAGRHLSDPVHRAEYEKSWDEYDDIKRRHGWLDPDEG
jgi:hypothetical protein